MPYVIGAKSFLSLCSEDVWGSNPNDASGSGSAAQGWVPVPCTQYGVRFQPQNRQGNPYLGIFQRKHNLNFRGMPSGNLVSPLYGPWPNGLGKSLAEYLMSWAFDNHESQSLPSKSAFWAEGPGVADKEHNGLRVNGATLVGSDDSGMLELTLDLMGQSESDPTSSDAIPADRRKLSDFEFPRCTFALGGAAVKLKAFTLQVQHNLQAHYLNSSTPLILEKTTRILTLQMTLAKDANTYDVYKRTVGSMTEFTGQITARGLHQGTGTSGTFSTLQIDFPRLAFVNKEDQGGIADVLFNQLNLVCLKPDSASNDMAMTWGQA